jgi:hypothetical protein
MPGQWPLKAEPAVMILHGLRADSSLVTDTECCRLLPDGADPGLRDHNLIRRLELCELVG